MVSTGLQSPSGPDPDASSILAASTNFDITICDSKMILDIGCRTGQYWKGRGGVPEQGVVGVDISLKACKSFHRRWKTPVVVADMRELPFRDRCARVLCDQAIEHVKERVVALKELLRVGHFVHITTVLRGKLAWYFYRTREGKWGLDPTHEIEYESPAVFLAELNGAGYGHLHWTVEPMKYFGVPVPRFRRMCVNKNNRTPVVDW